MSDTIVIRISRTGKDDPSRKLPGYATEGASGMDVCAALDDEIVVRRGETVLVPTGFRIAVPPGYEAQIRPRSGLAAKHGLGILNTPGTIDSDYRGEVKILLTNFGSADVTVRPGDRIAQMVICPVVRAVWEPVESLDDTARGDGGFGHTGR
ncbi:MAG TPA: dUTP diphosphatase [Bacteroidota bacterium]|nr:dUTP diphosphatase [Bacteroidota bacterium]